MKLCSQLSKIVSVLILLVLATVLTGCTVYSRRSQPFSGTTFPLEPNKVLFVADRGTIVEVEVTSLEESEMSCRVIRSSQLVRYRSKIDSPILSEHSRKDQIIIFIEDNSPVDLIGHGETLVLRPEWIEQITVYKEAPLQTHFTQAMGGWAIIGSISFVLFLLG